ncbi:hypothetical protein PFTANZ_06558 [Plasmodium falciparum Tanzania (2000708)]|uniref:Duffy-binding-like domain-containing protein n=1 Tax=Plasmodium falciparum Tanzania (2000708) TaxID=1036725 RepID=A0A024VW83_PLAFA|nr:hypothetical protein PFTANZ_06558 [Plasmodium falciparum Tanzania (2000708)]
MEPAQHGRGGNDYSSAKNAKELLDMIGKDVYDEIVKSDAEKYKGELKGFLSSTTIFGGVRAKTLDPCNLKSKYTELIKDNRNRYPCTNLSGKVEVKRFSNKIGGQCTNEKIEGNKYINGKDVGACAPYRRLHLCHHNLESIPTNNYNSGNARHNLLAEVCMAAKYEGDSIRDYYPEHQLTNHGFHTNICTALARSFADIGDIVRGRDLFYGNTHESTQRIILENNLKTIFANIYKDVTKTSDKNGKALKTRYEGDAPTYYKLREDWWYANRAKVWDAITCEANGTYFRQTCSNGGSYAYKQCRCDGANVDPPTYFDYVPQFLRWFEEWAEDFCRLRKHKLKDAKEQCREKYKDGNKLYCDLNRYDCEKTAKGEKKFVEEDNCIGCHFSCSHFVDWIDNQKLEFLKQKNKYADEIKKYINGTTNSKRKKRSEHGGSNDNGYESKFYNKLKEKNKYVKVGEFLDLLSKETTCTKNGDIKEGGTINFKTVKRSSASGDGSNKTFSRTEICEPCPWCGIKLQADGRWERLDDMSKCAKEKEKTYNEEDTTTIEILTADNEKLGIYQKYKKFCEKGAPGKNGNQIVTWQCYYDKDKPSGQNNNCVQGEWKEFKKVKNVMPYNAFFSKWVHDMLIDSMQWRDEHGKCINKKEATKCITGCKKKCECFQKWVKQKQNEWEQVKAHYEKEVFEGGFTPYWTLEEYFPKIKAPYNEVISVQEFIKEIEQIIKKNSNNKEATSDDNSINKVLDHEKEDAKKCIEKHTNDICPIPNSGGARSGGPPDGRADTDSEEEEEEEDEVDDEVEAAEEVKDKVCGMVKALIRDNHGNNDVGECKRKDYQGKAYPEWDCDKIKFEENQEERVKDKVCGMVKALIRDNHGNNDVGECKRKDYQGKAYPEWDCDKIKFEENQEGACMPPRRQKLCLYFLSHEYERKNLNTQKGLRKAFIKTAAAETFLSWQYYNKMNGNKAKQLDNGTIPPEFLRSMIYTFGDYRDICMDTDISSKIPDDDVNKAKDNIKGVFSNSDDKSPSGQKTTPKEWWTKHGPDIWKGMLCALEKASGDKVKFTTNPKYTFDKVTFSGDSKSPTLEKFAQTPQFLRWFIEWSDQFCRERGIKIKALEEGCREYKCNGDNGKEGKKEKCEEACEDYKKWIETWKNQYEKQSEKFRKDKNEQNYKHYPSTVSDINNATDAHDYLATKLNNCHGTCNCLKEISTETNPKTQSQKTNRDTSKNKIPITLEYPPKEINGKCDCTKALPPQEAPAPTVSVDVCETVKTALTGDNLTKACEQKYGPKAPTSWKCIPTNTNEGATMEGSSVRGKRSAPESGSNSDKNGAICIPPRRRRLYVGHLQKWATTSVTQPQGETSSQIEAQTASQPNSHPASPSDPRDGLRDAFIQTAAIETFFAWHKYKAENTKTQSESPLLQTLDDSSGGDENDKDPQEELKQGTIPDGFLRQMFYTLGDYRDICVGKTPHGIDTVSASDKDTMEKIKTAIEKFFEEYGKNQESGSTHTQNSVKTPSTSDKTPQQTPDKWWEANGEYIWKGMVCALTYEDSGQKAGTPTQNEEVYKKFFGENNGNPVTNTVTTGTPNGTYTTQYEYNTVKLDEHSGVKPTEAPTHLSKFVERPPYFRYLEEWGQNFCKERKKRLKQIYEDCKFVERPPYFRYLEEWGQNFCKERKKRLKQIYEDCKVDKDGKNGNKKCSGYGEDCQTNLKNDPSTIPSLECPDCGRECRKYKKWIEKKKTEYENQQKAYDGQKKQNCKEENGGTEKNNGFCAKLKETCTEAKDFLKTLGSCKIENGVGKTIFDDDKTFKHTKDCDPCSEFIFKCENGKCSGTNGNTCNGRSAITKDDIKEKTDGNEIVMSVSDNSATEFKGDLKDACGSANIFKSIRKDEWTCEKVCAKGKHIIQIRALVKRWVEYFFEDYNKIKKKLNPCMNSSEGSACIKECVEKWVEEKKKEWKNLKNLYLQQYENADESYPVKTILQELHPQTQLNEAIKPCPNLEAFANSCGLNGADSSQKKNTHERDIVKCLLEKLQVKANKCKDQASGETCTDTPQTQTLDDETLDDDIETEEVKAPEICPNQVEDKKKEEEGDECNPATPSPETDDEGNKKENVAETETEPAPPTELSEGTEDQPKGKPPEPVKPAPAPTPPQADPLLFYF